MGFPNYPAADAICEEAVKYGLEPSQQICMRREEMARTTLRARWQSFPQRKRAQCVSDGAVAMMGASYDNLLWCLDRVAWQKIRSGRQGNVGER